VRSTQLGASDIAITPIRGFDSCVVQYDASGCHYDGDYGAFGAGWDAWADQAGFTAACETVEDRDQAVRVFETLQFEH
jgi:hypothetical protein